MSNALAVPAVSAALATIVQAAVDRCEFRGKSDWEAQQLLASTAAMLHVVPILTATHFADAEAAHPQIAGNDLIAAEEPVRVTPDSMSIDELNGVWALYPPGSFALTLAVSAGPVLIDGTSEEG